MNMSFRLVTEGAGLGALFVGLMLCFSFIAAEAAASTIGLFSHTTKNTQSANQSNVYR